MWMAADGRMGVGHRPDVQKRKNVCFLEVRNRVHGLPPPNTNVWIAKFVAFRTFSLRAIQSGCPKTGEGGVCVSSKRTMLNREGGVQKVTFWSDVFDG